MKKTQPEEWARFSLEIKRMPKMDILIPVLVFVSLSLINFAMFIVVRNVISEVSRRGKQEGGTGKL